MKVTDDDTATALVKNTTNNYSGRLLQIEGSEGFNYKVRRKNYTIKMVGMLVQRRDMVNYIYILMLYIKIICMYVFNYFTLCFFWVLPSQPPLISKK